MHQARYIEKLNILHH